MKQKTKKAAKKRFTISARGKVRHRSIGQAHFNAKDTGDETRRKHVNRPVSSSDMKRVRLLVPYTRA